MTHGNSFCYHEALRFCSSEDRFKEMLSLEGYKYVGNSDSGLGFFTSWLPPDSRVVIVERDSDEVINSLNNAFINRFDMGKLNAVLETTLTGLELLKKEFDTLVIPYGRFTVYSCGLIWNHCLPDVPFNRERTEMLIDMKITVMEKDLNKYMETSSWDTRTQTRVLM
jgi:hypothetical protein